MSMFMGIVLIVYYSRVNTSDDMCVGLYKNLGDHSWAFE